MLWCPWARMGFGTLDIRRWRHVEIVADCVLNFIVSWGIKNSKRTLIEICSDGDEVRHCYWHGFPSPSAVIAVVICLSSMRVLFFRWRGLTSGREGAQAVVRFLDLFEHREGYITALCCRPSSIRRILLLHSVVWPRSSSRFPLPPIYQEAAKY